MVQLIRRQLIFILALLWLGFWSLAQYWPPSWWLEVRAVRVFDGPAMAEVVMDVDRIIHRDFVANWSALVRRWDGDGWTVYCTATGFGNYRPDATLPDPVTLNWWTNGKCPTLGTGRYLITTIWTIHADPLPDKIIQTDSNVFEIRQFEGRGRGLGDRGYGRN